MENNQDYDNNLQENKNYFIVYLILLVVGILLVGITGAYAFFAININGNNTTTSVTSSLDCIDLTYSESDRINLTNQYPVSEEYALAQKPVTATITNNCKNSVPYTLAITTLKETLGYTKDSIININVKQKIGKSNETDFIKTKKISELTNLTGTQLEYLNSHLRDTALNLETLTIKVSYIIDNNRVIEPNTTNTYRIYLWVDYNEGGSNNSTENQLFNATLSVIVG